MSIASLDSKSFTIIPLSVFCKTVKGASGTKPKFFSLVKRHIMDMGITKGTELTLVKVAPLGDPMELEVRGYELSIRASEAKDIEIE